MTAAAAGCTSEAFGGAEVRKKNVAHQEMMETKQETTESREREMKGGQERKD